MLRAILGEVVDLPRASVRADVPPFEVLPEGAQLGAASRHEEAKSKPLGQPPG